MSDLQGRATAPLAPKTGAARFRYTARISPSDQRPARQGPIMETRSMLMVISPAKTLDMETPSPIDARDQPELIDHASELVAVLREKDAAELARLMCMSAGLGGLNWERFREWQAALGVVRARPAVGVFRG